MIVDPDFFDHWRTRMLADLLDGDEMAPLYVLRLFAHCQNRRQTRLKPMPNLGLKSLCRYPGDAEKFVEAMLASGYVERDGEDGFACPKFAEYNAQLLTSWENGKKGGRPKKKPEQNPSETQGEPAETREEKSREDKRRKKGETPLPPSRPDLVAEELSRIEAPKLQEATRRWLKYKSERREAYKPTGLQTLITRTLNLASQHGIQAVVEAIERAMANGWKGFDHDVGRAPPNGAPKREFLEPNVTIPPRSA